MTIWQIKAIQNSGSAIGLPEMPCEKSQVPMLGNTVLGPIALGAVARATMTQIAPMIWANTRVAQTWRRDSV